VRLFNRKSQMQRLLDTVTDPAELPNAVKSGMETVGSSKALKTGLIAVGGIAGLAAGSAGISSLRRHGDGADEE
jgi:hypothetical protein